jgi:hypothetical protein
MKVEKPGTTLRFYGVALFLLVFTARVQAFELGAGAKIDVAPYGIENITALVLAAPWIDVSQGLQAGIIATGSAGASKIDMELSACLRVWPEGTTLALFDGVGVLAENDLWPALIPILVGGLRIGAAANAIVACIEVHYKETDSDTMLWLAFTRRL